MGRKYYIDSTTGEKIYIRDTSPSLRAYRKAADQDAIDATKQDKLTAGTNITIDENNVISATGGGGDVADVLVNNESVVDPETKIANIEIAEGEVNITLTPTSISDGTTTLNIEGKQDTLTAGENITIENNVISANGGGLVDDVKVDGESVVTNKVANIDLSSKQDKLTAGENITIEQRGSGLPAKGDIITLNLGGTEPISGTANTYRVLSIDGTHAKLMGMFSILSQSEPGKGSWYSGSAVDIAVNQTFYNALTQQAKDAIIETDFNIYKYANSNRSATHASSYDYTSKALRQEVGPRYIVTPQVSDIEEYFDHIFGYQDLYEFFTGSRTIDTHQDYIADTDNDGTGWWLTTKRNGSEFYISTYGSASDVHPVFNIDLSSFIETYLVISATGGSGEPDAYIKNASVSNNTLTLTKKDNTTVTFEDHNTTYTAGANISINNNVISATDTIYDDTEVKADIADLQTDKQDVLIAGSNITIAADGKTISATDTTYSAGTGITIANNVISATGGGGEPAAYLKSAAVSDTTLTITNKDDTTVVYDPQLIEGQIDLTLTDHYISDGTTTFEVSANPATTTATLSSIKIGNTSYAVGGNGGFDPTDAENEMTTDGFNYGRQSGSTPGQYSVALGNSVRASGYAAFAEGNGTLASGRYSHAEGANTTASGDWSHTEGQNSQATNQWAHAEGYNTRAANGCHAEGYQSNASGNYSHAEGYNSKAKGAYSHAEGYGSITDTGSFYGGHAEGYNTVLFGESGHTEGRGNRIPDDLTSSSGLTDIRTSWADNLSKFTLANGSGAHAEGEETVVHQKAGHAEGYQTKVLYKDKSDSSHAGGHAEGRLTHAYDISHAEGNATNILPATVDITNANTVKTAWLGSKNFLIAHGDGAHAEGHDTCSLWTASHAEGYKCGALSSYTHAEGQGTIASATAQHVQGKYNAEDTTKAFIIGNGTSDSARSNAMTVDWNGNIQANGLTDGTTTKTMDEVFNQMRLHEIRITNNIGTFYQVRLVLPIAHSLTKQEFIRIISSYRYVLATNELAVIGDDFNYKLIFNTQVDDSTITFHYVKSFLADGVIDRGYESINLDTARDFADNVSVIGS